MGGSFYKNILPFLNSNLKNFIYFVLFIYAALAAWTIIYFDGTGDTGDSVSHYLFAKYAPKHPELYFDHWAKPVFVLLASPFAQFGFIGMKIFNSCVVLLTILTAHNIAKTLKFRNAIIVSFILICTPLYFTLTFSGLTEPLFALVVSISILLLLKDKYVAASILISFLPFIRSEGLLFIGIFAIYFAFKCKWKMLPFLVVGHLIYSFLGYFIHHDLLWVIREIPYAHLDSIYGNGTLFHFSEKLYYLLGLPIYFLFVIGLIAIYWDAIKKKSNLNEQVLLALGFLTFFIAHSLFWFLGIFGSMGLLRVFICVMPIIALVALKGYNFITETVFGLLKLPQLIFKALLIIGVIIFPFTTNKAALNFNRDFSISQEQLLVQQVADFSIKNYGTKHAYVCAHPYFSLALDIDPFDKTKMVDWNESNLLNLQSGSLLIWDSHFALIDLGVTKITIDSDSSFVNIYNASKIDQGKEILMSMYLKK